MAVDRGPIIARMYKAVKEGWTVSKFIAETREAGFQLYRRTDLLRDWRTVAGIQEKKDRLKYVRKDYFPKFSEMAESTWGWSKEFNYKMRAYSQIVPGEPLREYNVTIQSDVPLTPRQMESQVYEKWSSWEAYGSERLVRVEPVVGIRRVG